MTERSERPRWLVLERWIVNGEVENFTVEELASSLGVTVREGSRMIQSYLTAQRGKRSRTSFVLKRAGRTKRAVWSVGTQTADARTLGRFVFDDFLVTVKRAYQPDILRIKAVNPRAARFIVAKMESLDAAVQLLGSALDAEVEFHLAEAAENEHRLSA